MTDPLRTTPPPSDLILTAQRLLLMSYDDVIRTCPVIVLRALTDLAARHEAAVQDAYERGACARPRRDGEGEMSGE